MNKAASAILEFDPSLNTTPNGKALSDGLSVALQLGNDLWVANDETTTIERLTLQALTGASVKYRKHRQFELQDYIQFSNVPSGAGAGIQEADIEGLDYADGYFWIVGSHTKVRAKPGEDKPGGDPEEQVKDNQKRLANVTTPANRMLLARIPLDKDKNTLTKELTRSGKHSSAAWLKVERGAAGWQNEFTRGLANDEHLAPFAGIPGKENGLDIEGLAVADERIFVGLRGPVLRGFALILELEPEAHASTLTLKKIGPGDRPYRKHFVHLGGLGIRDLCLHGDDMLILAGPTMELNASHKIFKWTGGANPPKRSLVRAEDLQTVVDIPHSIADGYAEGMTLFKRSKGDADSILVVYDAAAGRKEGATIKGDIFGPLF